MRILMVLCYLWIRSSPYIVFSNNVTYNQSVREINNIRDVKCSMRALLRYASCALFIFLYKAFLSTIEDHPNRSNAIKSKWLDKLYSTSYMFNT